MFPSLRRSFTAGVLLVVLAAPLRGAAGSDTGFLNRTFVDDAGPHQYTVYVPDDYADHDQWPIVLYLHGAGGRGNDGEHHLLDGLAPVIRHRGRFPAIVVFPQCENVTAPILKCWEAGSPDGLRAIQILEGVEQEFSIDPTRRVLAGWSMGGYGAWSLAAADPDRWSAVLPISGGGDSTRVTSLTKTRIWAIHGERDRAIPVERSIELVDAVHEQGGSATLTVLPGVGHAAWKQAFLSRSVVDWMFGTGPPATEELISESQAVSTRTLDSLDGPFEPALIVPRAVTLRLGLDALRTMAYGVPDVTPVNALSGGLEPIAFTLDAAGERLDVRLEDLGYNLRLHRAIITTTAAGNITLKLGLRPFEVRIGRTEVRGARHYAAADAVLVQFGHRRPVWINLTLSPSVVDHQVRFRILRSEFRIPDDNWIVHAPDDVEFRGPDLTADMVRSGIVGGLYVRRHDFEDKVLSVIPKIVREIEERLTPPATGDFAASVWPLPVFQPRMQLMVHDLAVDAEGISVSLDVAVANLDPLDAPAPPRIVDPIGPRAAEVPKSRDLQVHVASRAIEPLAQMLVDTGVGRIDVRDLPQDEFAAFADPEELGALLPGLREHGEDVEVRSELILSSAFFLDPAPDQHVVMRTDDKSVRSLRAALDIPQMTIAITVRSQMTGGDWRPFGHIDMHLRQRAAIRLNRPAYDRRTLEFRWDGAPEIDAEFAGFEPTSDDSTAPFVAERVLDVIRKGWQAWTADSDESPRTVPDIEVGSTRLRLEQVGWDGDLIVAAFQTPDTRIVNSTPRSLTYEVRGPFSNWGRPHTLLPGEFDDYDAPYPLTIRFPGRRNTQPRWLPLGSLNAIEPP